METLDFHVEIGAGSTDDRDPGRPRSYEVTLRGSAGDEASEVRPFPLTPGELRALDTTVPHAVLSSAARLRRVPTDDELPVRELGRRLYEFLLGGKGRPLLAAARHRAARDDRPLRIVLRVRPAELARLPWEFLYDPDEDSYVCQTTPLVRHPEVSVPERPLTVRPPLRVLCMAARPDDQEPLAVRAEQEWLGRALSELRRQGLIHVEWTAGPTWRDLRTALRGGPWHAFHFIGHGGFDPAGAEGTLALGDDGGGTYHLGAEDLAMLLSRHTSLRLVVLNACETGRSADRDPFSSVAGALMRKGLPAAVAMQYPISNDAAVEFSRTFYESLAHRRPVDEAVTEARQTIRLARRGTLEWVTPVLFMRSLDGRLFDLTDAGTPVAAAADEVHGLYVAGLAALRRKRWQRAVEIFRDVMARDPGHPDAPAKYAEALRLRRLNDLYEAGLDAIGERRWDAAVNHLEAVAAADPAFLDTPTHLTEARRHRAAATWHTEVAAFHAAGEWEAVLAVGTELAALLPEDPDPDGLVADARARLGVTGDVVPGEVPAPVSEVPVPAGESGTSKVRTPVRELAPDTVDKVVPGEVPVSVGELAPGEVGVVVSGEVPVPVGELAPDTVDKVVPGEAPVSVGELAPDEVGEVEQGELPVPVDELAPGTANKAAPLHEPAPVSEPSALARDTPDQSVEPRVTHQASISDWAPPVVQDSPAPTNRHASTSSTARSAHDVPVRVPGRPLAFAFSPDGTRFVIACLGRKALVADVLDPGRSRLIRHDGPLERLGRLAREDRLPIAAALAPGGRRLVTYAVPTLRMWDVDARSQLAEWRTDETEGRVALGAEGLNALFLPGSSGAYHWPVSQDAPARLTAQEARAALAVTSRDGTMFATVDASADPARAWVLAAQGVRTRARDLHVRVWDAATGRLLAERNCGTDVIRVALHPRNTVFVTGHGDGKVRVWGPEGTGRVVAGKGSTFFMDIAYDSEGNRLAVAKENGASVQDLHSGQLFASRRYGFDWTVRALAFGPDGVARALVERAHEVWLTTIATMAQGIRGIWDDDGPTHARLRGDVP
ncbi:CHAT domain-containing protein [Streptomyces sp. NBC_01239]|uniref:CHAT domain-containing protein n=1 Tax=Streptomyces sp. NBC_01239 TaxID=2903792 RepID=UPI00224D0562|nr:CHAT domain-containing protein [Streptomyces sp. NBC_01239]MCX4814068.1 CHAT domain-containing protein [Streptomyces sp. NBC_01239]